MQSQLYAGFALVLTVDSEALGVHVLRGLCATAPRHPPAESFIFPNTAEYYTSNLNEQSHFLKGTHPLIIDIPLYYR